MIHTVHIHKPYLNVCKLMEHLNKSSNYKRGSVRVM